MTNSDLIMRLFFSVVLGGLVGLERERHNRPAGLRTHILVSLGSTLVMIVSIGGFGSGSGIGGDPARIASQVVSGIGFLGAGTILRQGGSVRGLTTAASIWVVAAIGLAVGIGLFLPAVLTTAFVLASLWLLHRVDAQAGMDQHAKKQLWLRMKKQQGLIEQFGALFKKLDINIIAMHLTESGYSEKLDSDTVELTLIVNIPASVDIPDFLGQLQLFPGLIESTLETAKRRTA